MWRCKIKCALEEPKSFGLSNVASLSCRKFITTTRLRCSRATSAHIPTIIWTKRMRVNLLTWLRWSVSSMTKLGHSLKCVLRWLALWSKISQVLTTVIRVLTTRMVWQVRSLWTTHTSLMWHQIHLMQRLILLERVILVSCPTSQLPQTSAYSIRSTSWSLF